MAEVSSSSTLAQVQASYQDNASYAEDNSVTKAKRFVTACRILIQRQPSNVVKGSNQVSLNLQLLHEELKAAQKWLEARDVDSNAGPLVTRPDFRRFR